MPIDQITIRGAREHNLKNVSLTIPRDKLVVFTGLSGSGKSSLAFDTIYAEGQRRYVESLSAYARQFLGQMEKPDVDQIDGLSPAISIDQKGASRNPRSTVGTVTEIYDHLRLLFARIGRMHCPVCGREIARQTVEQMVDQLYDLPEGTLLVHLPDEGKKGTDRLFSERYACPVHGGSFEEPAPRNFSFNSPHGACPDCTGLGSRLEIDPDLVLPNKDLSIAEGAVLPWRRMALTDSWFSKIIESVAEHYGF